MRRKRSPACRGGPPQACAPHGATAWHWPLTLLMAWSLGWALWLGAARLGWTGPLGLALACLPGVLAALRTPRWWRRLWLVGGFPLSLLMLGGFSLPTWTWVGALVVLLLIYSPRAWQDAPLFPTPHHALKDLAAHAPLAQDALIFEAGCGLGDGLIALRRAYPQARLQALEWSWPLAVLAGLRCPWAHVRRGDIWAADWSAYDLVYLFQRPETMPRAWAQAQAQMRPGSWLVSLEFAVPQRRADASLDLGGGRQVWLYRMGARPPAAR